VAGVVATCLLATAVVAWYWFSQHTNSPSPGLGEGGSPPAGEQTQTQDQHPAGNTTQKEQRDDQTDGSSKQPSSLQSKYDEHELKTQSDNENATISEQHDKIIKLEHKIATLEQTPRETTQPAPVHSTISGKEKEAASIKFKKQPDLSGSNAQVVFFPKVNEKDFPLTVELPAEWRPGQIVLFNFNSSGNVSCDIAKSGDQLTVKRMAGIVAKDCVKVGLRRTAGGSWELSMEWLDPESLSQLREVKLLLQGEHNNVVSVVFQSRTEHAVNLSRAVEPGRWTGTGGPYIDQLIVDAASSRSGRMRPPRQGQNSSFELRLAGEPEAWIRVTQDNSRKVVIEAVKPELLASAEPESLDDLHKQVSDMLARINKANDNSENDRQNAQIKNIESKLGGWSHSLQHIVKLIDDIRAGQKAQSRADQQLQQETGVVVDSNNGAMRVTFRSNQ